MRVCEICQKPASVHVTQIADGGAEDRHFCQEHASGYLGGGFYGRVVSPFNLSSLPRESHQRLGRAFETIGHSTGPVDPRRIVTACMELLGDEEPSLRYFAAVWLGDMRIAAREALPTLRVATDDENRHVRNAAIEAIEKIEG